MIPLNDCFPALPRSCNIIHRTHILAHAGILIARIPLAIHHRFGNDLIILAGLWHLAELIELLALHHGLGYASFIPIHPAILAWILPARILPAIHHRLGGKVTLIIICHGVRSTLLLEIRSRFAHQGLLTGGFHLLCTFL